MKKFFFNINPLYENNFVYNELQQKILITNWLELHKQGTILKDSFQYGFKTFSQTNEDGILLYIFTIIGTTNKKVVEVGINCDNSRSNIPESIATNLISFHGWHGLLLDGNESNSGQILHHFHLNKTTSYYICINEFPEISTEEAYKAIPAVYSIKERNELWSFNDLNNKFPNLLVEV